MCSQSAIVAFKRVVMLARATLGEEILGLPLNTSWVGKDVNINDPVEVDLAGRL